MRKAFLPLLLFLCLGATAQHNYLFEPTQYYEGAIGSRKVSLVLQNMYGTYHGFLLDDDHPTPFLLEAWETQGDSLTIHEYYHETGEFYLVQSDDSTNFLTGTLRVSLASNALQGVWKSATDGTSLAVNCRLVEQQPPSPEELQKTLETATLNVRVMTLSRWLCGAFPGTHLTMPMPYVGTSYFPEDGETSVEIQYQNLFGDERQEAVLTMHVGNYKTQVFVMVPTAQGWEPWSEFLSVGEMQGYTSCLYCMDQEEYARVRLFQACGGTWLIETMNCAGECKDGSSRGDHVTRDLYHIAESGFQTIFYDQLEEEYWYESPCPVAIDPPKHTDFTYLTPKGEKFPTQVRLTHVEYELANPKKKLRQGDCPEEDIYEEGEKTEEIIELCD